MTECICGNQDGSFIHVTNLACPYDHNSGPVDSFHYRGSREAHSNPTCENFINMCKQRLPNIPLPIKMGWTGYIDFEHPLYNLKNCWCTDEQGRVVILVNGTLMFQRYTEGDMLMQRSVKTPYWSELDEKDINTFLTQL
jgi:hypothetical protein